MATTIKEIAKRTGVTMATVSFALKGRTDKVGPKVRQRILQVAKELDYHPHIIARGLVTKRTQNIGIAVRSIEYLTDMYFGTIMQGIAYQVGLHDYNMQFEVTDSSDESAKNLHFIKKAKEKSIDGIIIIDQVVSGSEIIRLKNINVPFVLVDRSLSDMDVCCVRVNNRKGIYAATEHLIKKGHKRIVFACECMKHNKIIDMFKGYSQALKKYEIPVDKELTVEPNSSDVKNSIFREVERVLRVDSPPTAILCSCHLLAVLILRVLREMKIMVPQDMALVGYNDDPNFAHVEPSLTTVQVPLRRMGEEAARMLFKLISDERIEEHELILESHLVVRQSCGAKK